MAIHTFNKHNAQSQLAFYCIITLVLSLAGALQALIRLEEKTL